MKTYDEILQVLDDLRIYAINDSRTIKEIHEILDKLHSVEGTVLLALDCKI